MAKAIETEDPEKRMGFTACIGNFMKLVYQNWSKELVNDETIKNDLRLLSRGKLQVTENPETSARWRAPTNLNRLALRYWAVCSRNKGGKFRHGGSNNNNGGHPRAFQEETLNVINPFCPLHSALCIALVHRNGILLGYSTFLSQLKQTPNDIIWSNWR